MRKVQLILPMLVVGLLIAPSAADAEYRYLCTSISDICSYTGPDAPVLDVDVCYSAASGVHLMVGDSCPEGSWPYHVDYGEIVDPLTGEVSAYIPLDDACDQPGLCVDGPPPPDAQEHPMCCQPVPWGEDYCVNGASCGEGGIVWFCFDGVCNDDGSITCFHAEEI